MQPRFSIAFLPLAAALLLGSCSNTTQSDSAATTPPAAAAAPTASAAPPPSTVALTFAGCVSPHEREAFEVYALRTEAMVGAQSCRMTDRFNTFATRFRGELTTHGRALRSYYQKTHGKRGDAALDEFVTQLSNVTFVDGSNGGDFCAKTTTLFEEVMATPVGKLAVFSAQHPAHALPPMDACGGAPAKKG